jgi:hypothetical protein
MAQRRASHRRTQFMKHATLRGTFGKQQQAELKAELALTRRQLELVTQELTASRKVKPINLELPKRRPKLKGDIIRVAIPDTHGAKVDKRALAACLSDVKTMQPQEVILLGDHVDCGGFLAQHHVMGYVAETAYSYSDDVSAANDMLDALQLAATNAKIEYLEGNHCRRVETWCITGTLRHPKDAEMLRQALAPEFRLKLKDRGIPYYRQSVCYDGLTVPGVIKRGKCFYFHGFSTAKFAVSTTQSKVAGNCVFAHTHRAQSDITSPISTGEIGAWNPGCLCEKQPLWQHTRPTDWTHGYAVQLISHTGKFLHLNVPIIDGASLLTSLIKH